MCDQKCTHADAGEVERLRVDRDSLRETFDNLIDKLGIVRSEAQKEPGKPSDVFAKHVDKLRAQLAERDALLRKLAADPAGSIRHYVNSIDAALSASAEPSAPKCETCSDHGIVGNILNAEPCPDCSYSAPAERDERAEFEAHCGKIGFTLKCHPNGEYAYGYGFELWTGWQARAALERKPSDLVAQLQRDLTERDEENDALRESLRLMAGDYRAIIVNVHERITLLGGDSDSVEKMLADNPNYAKARALLERKP